MAKKIEKIDFIKLLKKLDKKHFIDSEYEIISNVVNSVEKIKITNEDINKICGSRVSTSSIIFVFIMIIESPDKFILERSQFQKFCNTILNEKLINKEDMQAPNKYYRIHQALENRLETNSSYFDYDENGADIASAIINLKDILSVTNGCRICATEYVKLIDAIRQEQLNNMTSNILENDTIKNKKLIENTFGNANVINSFGYSLLMLCQNRKLTDDELYRLIVNLLESGVDPNIRNYTKAAFYKTHDYLELLLDNKCFDDFVNTYFSDIFKKSIECGYNPDSIISLFQFAVNKKHKYIKKIYDAICEYDFLVFDDEEEFKKLNFYGYDDIANSIKYRTILSKIGEKLEEKNYTLEDNFFNKLIEVENEILMFFNSILYNFNEKELLNLLVEEIIKNRNNSINLLDEKISAVETLNSLKLMVEYFYNDFNKACDKCVTKIKNM